MRSVTTADPVRAQVEETLRHVVDTVTAVPCELARRSRDAAGRAAERVSGTFSTSVGLARTFGELAFGGLLGLGRSAVAPPTERPPSALTTAPAAAPDPVAAADRIEPSERADPAADHLPLDDYESLAASHVVARLARLSAAELVQVRTFEQAHRGRRTILGKIEQLLNT